MNGGGGGGATIRFQEPTTADFTVLHQPDILLSCSPSLLPPADVFVFQIKQSTRVQVYEFSDELHRWQLQRTENRGSHASQYFIVPLPFIPADDEPRASSVIDGMLGTVGVSRQRGPITKEIYSAAVRYAREYENDEAVKRIPILVDVVSVNHNRITRGVGNRDEDVSEDEDEDVSEYEDTSEDEDYEYEEEEDEYRIIPATEWLIEALEKVKVAEEEVVCSICLEEMKAETEASKMPCKHIFHGSCIAKWLGRMRVCPLCRFQMPTYPIRRIT